MLLRPVVMGLMMTVVTVLVSEAVMLYAHEIAKMACQTIHVK